MMPYERFDAWHACYGLTLLTYRITAQFPNHERYGLVSQMRRAAFSTAANIAEGAAKRGRAEFRRFLDMSLGSRAGKVTMGLYKSIQSTIRRSVDPPIRR